MRVFFALQPDAATALAVADWRDRQLHCTGRAVSPANFHITLAFIGELEDAALDRLCRSVTGWLESAAPGAGQLVLDRTGYWPRPGIFWLGPGTWPEDLNRTSRKLGSLGAAVGARVERRAFVPHLTLFRRCQSPPPAPGQVPPFTLPYQHFALCESRQGRTGVSYHDIAGWELDPAA